MDNQSSVREFGLIGYPLTHSFSQRYFTAKWRQEGIENCRYSLFPLTEIGQLEQVLADHPRLEGLNVTIPYKETVIPFLQGMSEEAASVGAVNVITIRAGSLKGYNSDVYGFEQALRPHLTDWHQSALVLGSGGGAKAVIYVLKRLGIGYRMVSRHGSESGYTYQEVTPEIMSENHLVINTTPLGMYPHLEQCPDLPYEAITPRHLFFDLIYNPEKTLFLQRAEQNSAHIENGLKMLVLQAEKSWEIWNR